MLEGLLIDGARFGHFIGFALGIGAGCFADYSLLRKLDSEVSSCDISNIELIHRIVWVGLLLLWGSGFVILYARTGFQWAEFTPKLLVKLLVVGILTLNAILLGMIAMPILRSNINRSYMTFSLEHKVILCLLAALSTCSWISGLVLGIFSALKPADFGLMLPMFGFFYAVATVSAIVAAICLHIVWERRCGVDGRKVILPGAKPEALQDLLDVRNSSTFEGHKAREFPSIDLVK